jgi:NitT/TauT family transport system substrate-binding protein
MSAKGPGTDKVLAAIAEGSQDSLQSYKEQLSTTHMLFTPQAALQLATSADMKQKMTLVKQFCFTHGLLGENTKSVDEVAIRYPDATVQGKADRVRLRFETAYMQAASEGKL